MTSRIVQQKEVNQLLGAVIEGATSSKEPLSDTLRLCMRLSALLKNQDLIQWAKAEAGGYPLDAELPDYRILPTDVHGTFSGRNHDQFNNLPIPKSSVEEDHRSALFNAHIFSPVGEIESMASRKNGSGIMTIQWSGDSIAYYQRKEIYKNGLILIYAERMISLQRIAGILETVRTRVLDFGLQIREELGLEEQLEEKSIELPPSGRITQIFHNNIIATNVALGNSGPTLQLGNVQAGNLESLEKFLKNIGLPLAEIQKLKRALQEDSSSVEQPGNATKGWIARKMQAIGRGTLVLSGNTSANVIGAAISKYLGLT